MGLFMRRRRPVARLAAGAATAGVAYHMGKQHVQQQQYNQEADAAYQATQGGGGDQYAPQPQYAPAPQYAPPVQYAPAPPPPPAAPPASSDTAELEKLAQLHSSGALSDEEFTAAKAKLLGI
jgi:hypothetical protein